MKVAVTGLGYAGTVTAACMAARGHHFRGVAADVSGGLGSETQPLPCYEGEGLG